jgi:hypothetical protein
MARILKRILVVAAPFLWRRWRQRSQAQQRQGASAAASPR